DILSGGHNLQHIIEKVEPRKMLPQMRQGGIEPPSIAWKATMLTITPLTRLGGSLIN
uniref:Transposase n=1 Tax=Loa loa TaxID=7209 RepID=A0A1I7W0I5_LOALO